MYNPLLILKNRGDLSIILNMRPHHAIPLLRRVFFSNYITNKSVGDINILSLDIEPTTKCNFECKYCQVPWSNRSKNVKDLSLSQFKMILDQFPDLLSIKLQGMGEPLMNPDFFDMVELATKRGIFVSTNSNGSLLNDRMAKKMIKSGLRSIQISMDGATKETYERIRKKGNFDLVVRNIHNLVNERGKSKHIAIKVWMVGTKDNIGEFPELIRLCKSLGVDKVTLQHHLNFWGNEDAMHELSSLSINREQTETGYAKEVDLVLEEAKKVAKEIKQPMSIYRGNTLYAGQKCAWPWQSAYISSDGYVIPCCIIANPDVINFGNIFNEDFKEIWNSKEYMEFRQAFIDRRPPAFCAGCFVNSESA